MSNIEGFVGEVESSCSQRKAMTLVRVSPPKETELQAEEEEEESLPRANAVNEDSKRGATLVQKMSSAVLRS